MVVSPVVLQSVTPTQIAGTVAGLALFLSLTAHLAARNVLGDVPIRRAFVVGPVPAVIAVVFVAFEVPAFVTVPVALAADATVLKFVYGRDLRVTAFVLLIHVVVSILLAVVLFGTVLLVLSAPI